MERQPVCFEEKKYQFRERLSVVHPANIRDFQLTKAADESEHTGMPVMIPKCKELEGMAK